MKSTPYTLISQTVLDNVIHRLKETPLDGKTKVVIGDAGSKSARQRGLQWLWYTEVANAGIGGWMEDDHKDGVHLFSKEKFAVPIFLRDDAFFADLYSAWVGKYGNIRRRMLWFVDTQVHTEKMTVSQMAEFLTEFQRYYGPKVNLTDPDEKGLLQVEHKGGGMVP